MDRAPVIGITTQNLQVLDGIPPALPPSWVMSQRFIRAAVEVGGIPWLIPLVVDEGEGGLDVVRAIYERLDGVLVPGGADPDPSSYGAARGARCERSDLARDRVEMALLRWSREDGKPALGLCRGHQMMNLVAGGTLWQDLGSEWEGTLKHDYFPGQGYARDHLAHPVRIDPASRLATILEEEEPVVNSMHHQAIRNLGRGLAVSATARDGVIEAIEDSAHPFWIGVQWHPEELFRTLRRARRLFEAFVEAAREHTLRAALPTR